VVAAEDEGEEEAEGEMASLCVTAVTGLVISPGSALRAREATREVVVAAVARCATGVTEWDISPGSVLRVMEPGMEAGVAAVVE